MVTYQRFVVEDAGHVLLLHIRDSSLLDVSTVEEFARELDLIAGQRPARLIVDGSALKRCSTAVINALLQTKKRLLADGGDLSLSGLSDAVRYTFRALNLDGTVFQIFDSLEEALDQF